MIKKSYAFEKYSSRRIVEEFWTINSKKEEPNMLLKRFEKQEAPIAD